MKSKKPLNKTLLKLKPSNKTRYPKMTQGRCMKCKTQVEIKDPENVTMKNKMNAIKGVCPECGTKVFRITGKS